jgi:hypothetical protein
MTKLGHARAFLCPLAQGHAETERSGKDREAPGSGTAPFAAGVDALSFAVNRVSSALACAESKPRVKLVRDLPLG